MTISGSTMHNKSSTNRPTWFDHKIYNSIRIFNIKHSLISVAQLNSQQLVDIYINMEKCSI